VCRIGLSSSAKCKRSQPATQKEAENRHVSAAWNCIFIATVVSLFSILFLKYWLLPTTGTQIPKVKLSPGRMFLSSDFLGQVIGAMPLSLAGYYEK
jgi:heme/copper-type cytochrome/quinol oxidase subunit 3